MKEECKTSALRKVHIVRSRLSSGRVREYHYAWRGGPRLLSEPGTEAYDAERARLLGYAKNQERARALTKRRTAQRKELPRKEVAARLLSNAHQRARQRGLKFTLNNRWLSKQLEKQDHCCAITGIAFDYSGSQNPGYSRNPYAPSIDREQAAHGYTVKNSRLILLGLNIALSEWGFAVYAHIARAALKIDD